MGSGECIAVGGTNGGSTVPGDGAQLVQWNCYTSGDDAWWRFATW